MKSPIKRKAWPASREAETRGAIIAPMLRQVSGGDLGGRYTVQRTSDCWRTGEEMTIVRRIAQEKPLLIGIEAERWGKWEHWAVLRT